MSEERRFRSEEQSVGLAVTMVIFSAVILFQAIAAWRESFRLLGIAILLFGRIIAAVGLRASRAGATAEAVSLVVSNPFKTTRVPWSDIRAFSLGRHGLYPLVGIVELKDGSRLRIFGIQAPNPMFRPKNRSAHKLIEELNQIRRERTGEAAT